MKDEFGGEIIATAGGQAPKVDEFGSPIIQAAKATPDPSMVQQLGNALKSGGKMALSAMDYISHIGQPQWAKDLVQSIATDPKNAPQNPQQVAQKPSFLEAMGSVMPGQGMPTPPAGMDMRPLAATGVDQATSPSTYLSAGLSGLSKIPALARLAQAAGTVPGSAATAIGSKLTHIPGEALAEASTAAGRAGLKAAAEGAGPAGSKLADDLSAFSKNMPEKQIVDQALKQSGKVNIQTAINALEKAKADIPTSSGIIGPEGNAAIKKIDDMIARLKVNKTGPAAPGQAFKQNFNADEYRQIRQIIDEGVNWNEPGAKIYSDAAMKARTAMKNALIQAAPPEYANAMKSWHDKLDLASEMKSLIGKEEGARQDIRAGSFLKQTANEPANGPRRQLLDQFDKASGGTHLADSDLRKLAAEFGPTGKPSFMPRVSPFQGIGEAGAGAALATYGHPILGPIAATTGIAGSAPGVAVRAIQAANTIPAITSALGKNASFALAAAQRLAAARSQNEADFYSTKLKNFGLNEDQIKTLAQGK